MSFDHAASDANNQLLNTLSPDLTVEELHARNAHLLGALLGYVQPAEFEQCARAAHQFATRERSA